jgi:ribonuclease VapC
MIVDSSALVSVITGESEREGLIAALTSAAHLRMSAATYLETGVVIDARRDPFSSRRLDALLAELRVEVSDVTAEQARVARAAYRDFGKGSGHPARLNFGDCFSYALAQVTDEPLLFVGNDFAHTDVRRGVA